MNKLFVLILIAIIVGSGIFYYVNYAKFGDNPLDGNDENQNEIVTMANAKYFQDTLIARAIEKANGSMPIEGYDHGLLVGAFPGLTNSDFQGVKTFEGHYEVKGNSVEFIRDKESPISTAEKTVSEEGYKTLLINIKNRLRMNAESKSDIDAIIGKIDTKTETHNEAEIETRINQGTSALGIKIVPQQVLEDSRCPSDVQCIQAGTVRIRALLTSSMGEASQQFKLNETITTEAEEITLVRVEPQTKSTVQIKPGDYKFFFKIKKRTDI